MKRYILLTGLLFLITPFLNAQKNSRISAVSSKVYISIGIEKSKPPYLEIKNCYFEDNDGNKKIDSGEETFIYLDLSNSGMGPGIGLELAVSEKNNIPGLKFEKIIKLPQLKEKEQKHYSIAITGLPDLTTAKALFEIVVKEANGFNSDPIQIEIATEAFKEPLIKVVDFQLSSQNSGNLEKRKPFDLDLLIQNLGQGVANDVTVRIQMPMNVFCLSANESVVIGKLKPGEKTIVSYNLVTNNEYTLPAIDLKFVLSEQFGRFSENKTMSLTMNQKVSAEKLVVEGATEQNVSIEIASLSSDIDRNIPEITQKNPQKVALIIGNENYSGLNAEINVDYARRDAEVFRNYAFKTLGVEEKNIYFLTDATSGTMKRQIDLVVELVKRLGSNTELIFYYAGHGFPDENQRTPYLIPVDVNASNLTSAIPLREVYQKLSETGAKKITVVLDACFSGGGRNQGLLAARSVRIKPKEETISGNMVVFSASSSDQTALPYHDQKHGMFTYYLLKKLQESKGKVSFGELFEYLKNNVGVESLRINGKSQDPDIIWSPVLTNTWQNLTF